MIDLNDVHDLLEIGDERTGQDDQRERDQQRMLDQEQTAFHDGMPGKGFHDKVDDDGADDQLQHVAGKEPPDPAQLEETVRFGFL